MPGFAPRAGNREKSFQELSRIRISKLKTHARDPADASNRTACGKPIAGKTILRTADKLSDVTCQLCRRIRRIPGQKPNAPT